MRGRPRTDTACDAMPMPCRLSVAPQSTTTHDYPGSRQASPRVVWSSAYRLARGEPVRDGSLSESALDANADDNGPGLWADRAGPARARQRCEPNERVCCTKCFGELRRRGDHLVSARLRVCATGVPCRLWEGCQLLDWWGLPRDLPATQLRAARIAADLKVSTDVPPGRSAGTSRRGAITRSWLGRDGTSLHG